MKKLNFLDNKTESISTKLTNKKILMTTLIALTFIVGFSGQNAFAQTDAERNSVEDGIYAELAVPTDGTWQLFSFGGQGSSVGPFEYACSPGGSCTIMVTDGFLTGDQFEIIVDGDSLGLTSFVPTGGSSCNDPDVCFANPDQSKGTFEVPGGFHTMTIVLELSPFGGGDAWFKILNDPDFPIGGTSIPVSTTTLLVAGAQANMGLLSLALVGIVGAGAAIVYKTKSKKTEQ